MAGRYGPDQLYIALFVVAVILGIVASMIDVYAIMILSYGILAFAVFRFFSRNIVKRRAENDIFIRYWASVWLRYRQFKERMRSRKTHKFFKCPNCKNILRVPRGKGRIQITCPKCGQRFEKKS